MKPVPTITALRPGASASRVAIADAVTTTWRRLGTTTDTPRPMRPVRSEASASVIQTSR